MGISRSLQACEKRARKKFTTQRWNQTPPANTQTRSWNRGGAKQRRRGRRGDWGNRLKGNRSRLVIVQQPGGWLGALVNWRRIYGLGRLSGYRARVESGQSAFRCRRVQRRHASLRRAAGRRSRD